MAVHTVGSNRILEVRTDSISVVVKCSASGVFDYAETADLCGSAVDISAVNVDLRRVMIEACGIDEEYDADSDVSIPTVPLFFEQTDYEIIVRSNDGKAVTLQHEDPAVCDMFSPVISDDPSLISGVVNFKKDTGYSYFEIMHGGEKALGIGIDVFSSELTCADDRAEMPDCAAFEMHADDAERLGLPAVIEKQLALVNWDNMDVLVGSLGSREQFDDNIRRKYYYVPEKYIDQSRHPIRFIALYQSENMFGKQAGIRCYGEVIDEKLLKRSEIHFPTRRNNGDELYYAFRVKEWVSLPCAIAVRDEVVYEPKFTNLFLLCHCSRTFELFNIHSDKQYRLLYELNQVVGNALMNTNAQEDIVYLTDCGISVRVHEGCLDIRDENGEGLFDTSLAINEYLRSPKRYFGLISDRLQ